MKMIMYTVGCFVIVTLFYIVQDFNSIDLDYNPPVVVGVSSKENFMSKLEGSGQLLDTDDVHTDYALFDGEVNLSAELFNELQLRLNTETYAIAAEVFEQKHLRLSYNKDTVQYNTFMENIDPLMILALTCVEWGGKSEMTHLLSAPIASSHLVNKGCDLSTLQIDDVNKSLYDSFGINKSVLNEHAYDGPLQTQSAGMAKTDTKFGCIVNGFSSPRDAYHFGEAAHYIAHQAARFTATTSSWAAKESFDNKYAAMSHLGIMVNTGWSYMSASSASFNSTSKSTSWPWISASHIFEYVDEITKEENLNIILESAAASFQEKTTRFESGDYSGSIQLTVPAAYELFKKMGIEFSPYVKPQHLKGDGSLNADSLQRLMYPIQVIWCYYQLEKFYKGDV